MALRFFLFLGGFWDKGYKKRLFSRPLIPFLLTLFIVGDSLKPLYADLFYQIHAFFRKFDDPTKEFKNIFSAGVIVRVVFNQAFFIHSLLIAFDHPVNRAFAIHHIVKGFFGDFSDGDMVVIKDAIPLFFSFYPHHNSLPLRRSSVWCI